jgi:hypothetical protein
MAAMLPLSKPPPRSAFRSPLVGQAADPSPDSVLSLSSVVVVAVVVVVIIALTAGTRESEE